LRRAHPALAIGSLTMIAAEGDVLAYARQHGEERIIVALNMGHSPHAIPARGRLLLSTTPADTFTGILAPDQGVILLAQD
jgi:alpha-glucosidase